MDRATARRRVLESVAASQRLLGRHGPHGVVLEDAGWVAAIVPAVADSTLVNGAVVLDPRALPHALGRLTAAYEQAGVDRWGVLFAPDADAVASLIQAGLRPEAQPTAMAADLSEPDPHPDPAVTATLPNRAGEPPLATTDGTTHSLPVQPTTFATAGRINDQAYGHPDDRVERLIEHFPPEAAHVHSVHYAGEPASVALVSHHDSDAAVSFVATLPWARGLGLATYVLRHALRQAARRGATSSTLIASPMGHALYTALGYRDVGHLELWEQRRALS